MKRKRSKNKKIIKSRQTSKALQQSQARFKSIFESPMLGMMFWNAKGYITDANDAFLTMVGYTKEEVVKGKIQWWDMTPPEFKALDDKALNEIMETGVCVPYEKKYICKNGSRIPILQGAASLPGPSANRIAFVINLTSLKCTEEALSENIRRFKVVSKLAYDLIYEWDVTTNHLEWFGNIDGLLGYKKGKISGNIDAWLDLIHPQDKPKLRSSIELHRTSTHPIKYIYRVRHKNGTYLHWNDKGLPLLDRNNRPYKWIGVCTDITKRIMAQQEIKNSYKKLERTLEGAVKALSSTVGKRDPFTKSHQLKVTNLSCAIAEELGIPLEHKKGLRFAGLLHDIGKISVPVEILTKPGRLTDAEYRIVKTHVQHAYDILKDIEFPWPIADLVLQHHERLDGSGYPNGLKGAKILLEAKIIAVADVVEAMTSHRPYRPAPGLDKALAEIKTNRGQLYDPEIVDVCISLFEKSGFSFENEL